MKNKLYYNDEQRKEWVDLIHNLVVFVYFDKIQNRNLPVSPASEYVAMFRYFFMSDNTESYKNEEDELNKFLTDVLVKIFNKYKDVPFFYCDAEKLVEHLNDDSKVF